MSRVVAFSFLILVLAAFFSTTYAAVYLEIGTRDKAHPNKCFSKNFNIAMKIGKDYQVPGKCGAMSCDKSFTISIRTCGVVVVENCLLSEEDLTKPYPECCPQPICN